MTHPKRLATLTVTSRQSLHPYDAISKGLPIIKAWAIVWIVAYHLMGNTKGYFAVDEAIATLSKGNLKHFVTTGLDLFISAGSAGVNVFLIASGFGLTASWWHRYGRHGVEKIPLLSFWRTRMSRIFPLFWSAVAIATLLYCLNPNWAPFGQNLWTAGGLSPILALLSTVSTLRNFSSEHYYFLNGAWWYVGLCAQLYLIFPYLIRLGCRWGWRRLLMGALFFSLAYRAIFFLSPLGSISAVIPLSFFPSRLFEFTFGIFLAMAFRGKRQTGQPSLPIHRHLQNLLIKPQCIPWCFSLFLAGFSLKWLSYPTLHIFEEALMGVGLFCALINLSQINLSPKKLLAFGRLAKLTGKYSYGIYLTHMNVYLMLWPIASQWVPSYWIRFILVLSICCIIGIGFDAGFSAFRTVVTASSRQRKII